MNSSAAIQQAAQREYHHHRAPRQHARSRAASACRRWHRSRDRLPNSASSAARMVAATADQHRHRQNPEQFDIGEMEALRQVGDPSTASDADQAALGSTTSPA
jgi:hypothetical protein